MEFVVFLGAVFVAAVIVMWWNRRDRPDAIPQIPLAPGDHPEASISNESAVGPHRNVGRPWRVDRGNQGPGGGHSD